VPVQVQVPALDRVLLRQYQRCHRRHNQTLGPRQRKKERPAAAGSRAS